MTTPAQSQITLARMCTVTDTNLVGTVHGGHVMKFVDDAAGAAAGRFSGGPAVTAQMDEMSFHAPVRIGDILRVHARINWAGRTSMEIGVRAEVERWDRLSEPVHVASAYLVMVGVDEQRQPRQVPELVLETDEDRRRFREAEIRREHRLARRAAIEASRG
ncbi:MAG: acyl-CoA thioesterase [Micrococcales bacterium]|nr:acyl-CoA thioesterase [Micrococcales bacterium]